MKVVYTAPNKAHHYRYAHALHKAGCLHAFISGFPRINPLSKDNFLNGKLHHSDILQTLYIISLKGYAPGKISPWLAYLSKIEQDNSCRKFVKDCDVFLFYNGSGLNSSSYARKNGAITVVEVVNSHIEYQEKILNEESTYLNLKWNPSLAGEKNRRLKEYEQADYILLPSEFVKRSFLAKGFPEKKLIKVPYGFASLDNKVFEQPEKKHDSFTILYVGSISIRKGIRYLVEGFQKLKHPNKKLLLVGPDANDGALTGIRLTDDIVLTGTLKGDALRNAYLSANVFCLPSIEEGLALVLGEAISFGLPVLATCNTGAEDIIQDRKEGFIIPIRSKDEICEKLQLLADNPDIMHQMRLAALTKSQILDGWEESGNKLVDALWKINHANEK